MPSYLFVLRKTSFLLKPRSSTISLGSSKVCSRAVATWHPMPPLKSLIDVSSISGSPPSMGAGSQAWGSGGWISVLFSPRLEAWLTFCCLAARWASSSLVGRGLLVSITSLPFCSFLLLGSAYSILEGRVGWGARGGDFGGRGGSLSWADFPSPPFSGWFSINTNRLLWGFLWMPISSGGLLGDEGWLNTSNSSTDSVRSKNWQGWWYSCWKSGNRKHLGGWCTFGEWNAFRNHEPLVGDTNAVESRIFGLYHTLGSLERARDGHLSKD